MDLIITHNLPACIYHLLWQTLLIDQGLCRFLRTTSDFRQDDSADTLVCVGVELNRGILKPIDLVSNFLPTRDLVEIFVDQTQHLGLVFLFIVNDSIWTSVKSVSSNNLSLLLVQFVDQLDDFL